MPGSRGTVSYRPASQASSHRSNQRNSSGGSNDENNSSYESNDESNGGSRHGSRHGRHHGGGGGGGNSDYDDDDETGALSVPVETLVEHLLAARRALGTISQVLRGNELATEARALYTEAMVDAAQTEFLRGGIREQVNVLLQIRRGMSRAYDAGRRDFRMLIRTLDAANGQLEHTMEILRATTVATVFRPAGESPRNLLDFVDESGVEALRDAIKQSIAELQAGSSKRRQAPSAAQTSFDGDLLRFDTDLRSLNRAMAAAPSPPPPLPVTRDLSLDEEPIESPHPVPHLLASLTQRSRTMAENLASLTRHFDLCVTAVRTTEGGLELARWKAANASGNSQASGGGGGNSATGGHDDPVSISGVIAEQEAATAGDRGAGNDLLEPISAQERTEMIQVVLQDAAEVDDVVADMAAELHEAEAAFTAVHAHADQTQAAYSATTAAFQVLDDIGSRLPSYAEAETEFTARWDNERAVVADRLVDMDELRAFYEGYANAYDTLILESERRRTVEAKIQTVWRKARDAAERLVEADRGERANFRQEVGEFLPTDLWQDMDRPPRGVELFSSVLEVRQGQTTGASTTSVANKPSKKAAAAAPTQRKKNPAHDADADTEGGGAAADSILEDSSNDQSGSRGVGGSSTRTVVGR